MCLCHSGIRLPMWLVHCVYCVADGGPGWGLPPAKGRGRGTCYTTDNSKPLSADSPWKASSKQQHQLQPRNIATKPHLALPGAVQQSCVHLGLFDLGCCPTPHLHCANWRCRDISVSGP